MCNMCICITSQIKQSTVVKYYNARPKLKTKYLNTDKKKKWQYNEFWHFEERNIMMCIVKGQHFTNHIMRLLPDD